MGYKVEADQKISMG